MNRPDINWYEALDVAEYYAEKTPDLRMHWTKAGLHNLAHAYLVLLRENSYLNIALDEARGVAVDE